VRPFDKDEVADAAVELKVDPALVEKEWHAVRVIGVVTTTRHPVADAHFSGGTALSVGHALTARFSEDVDFKIRPRRNMDQPALHRTVQEFAAAVCKALGAVGYTEDPQVRHENAQHCFVRLGFIYHAEFTASQSLRPYLKVEMIGEPSAVRPIPKDLFCRVTRLAAEHAPETPPDIVGVPCVDPVETAADKVAALTWRVLTRNRQAPNDDPTLVRHFYDLHCMRTLLATKGSFGHLVVEAIRKDADRGGAVIDRLDPWRSVDLALKRVSSDKAYLREYDNFVGAMCFNNPPPPLPEVMASLTEIVKQHKKM